MALQSPCSVIKRQYRLWKQWFRRREQQPVSHGSNTTSSSHNSGRRASRPPRRSSRTSSAYRNAKRKTPKRPKLPSAVIRAKITHHLEKLRNESVELQAQKEKHVATIEDAEAEHEELVEATEALSGVKKREVEIQVEQESLLDRLWYSFFQRKPQKKPTIAPMHPTFAKRKRDLERQVQRVIYRLKLAKIRLRYAEQLHRCIQGEIKVQEEQRDEAEEEEEGELDFDEDLAHALENERVLRREARKKDKEEDRPSPTTNRVYYQPSLPRQDTEARRARYRAAQEANSSRQSTQAPGPSTGGRTNIPTTPQGRSNESTAERIGRLSLNQHPSAPYCGFHVWARKTNADTSCAHCGCDASGVVYCCTMCHVEICIPCFQRAQPEGAETGVSKFIFSTGDHAKG